MFNRRKAIQIGGTGLLGLTLPKLMRAAESSHIAAAANGRTGAIRIDEVSATRVKSVDDAGELAAKTVGGILNDRNRK